MTYRNVVSAVVRALAAETISSAGGCDFEPKVQCAKQKGEIVGKQAAFLTDCWVFGRLHKALSAEHAGEFIEGTDFDALTSVPSLRKAHQYLADKLKALQESPAQP